MFVCDVVYYFSKTYTSTILSSRFYRTPLADPQSWRKFSISLVFTFIQYLWYFFLRISRYYISFLFLHILFHFITLLFVFSLYFPCKIVILNSLQLSCPLCLHCQLKLMLLTCCYYYYFCNKYDVCRLMLIELMHVMESFCVNVLLINCSPSF